MFRFSDEQIEALFAAIWNGTIHKYDLSESLYYAIANYLKSGVFKGFGGSFSDFEVGDRDWELLDELRENIYMFSSAKTYQQTREMTDLLIGEEKLRSFPAFKKEALKVYNQYNVNWLEAEYETAVGQAMSAKKWDTIDRQKVIFPFLKYSAVLDKNTSDICKPLDGVVAAVGSSIWTKCAPLNHFRCRCVLEQTDRYDAEQLTPDAELDKIQKKVTKDMQPAFLSNPGIDKVVFNEKHPYFTNVPKEDRKFARKNFGLNIPEKED